MRKLQNMPNIPGLITLEEYLRDQVMREFAKPVSHGVGPPPETKPKPRKASGKGHGKKTGASA